LKFEMLKSNKCEIKGLEIKLNEPNLDNNETLGTKTTFKP